MPREFDSGVPVPGNRYVWRAPWQRCVPAPGDESRLRRPPPPRPRGRARRRARLQRGQPRPGRRVDPTSPGRRRAPPTESYLPDPIVTQVLAVLFGFIMLGGAILFFRNRTRVRAPAKPFTWWQVLARALGVAFLVAVLIAWPRALQAARERVGTPANAAADC